MCNREILKVFRGEEVLKTGCSFDAIITSHGIQKRYAAIMKSYRRKSISEIKRDFWLLTDEEEKEIDAFYKRGINEGFYGKNPDYYGHNPDKSRKNTTYNNILYNSTDVPHAQRAREDFFKEFPQVKPEQAEEATFEGIDFEKLSEKFRASKKMLQTRRSFSWIASHYSEILAGKYDDFPEAEQSAKPAPSLPPSVEAANARAARERWYSERRNQAEAKADQALEKARSIPAFAEAEKQLRRLELEEAKAEVYSPEKMGDVKIEKDAWTFERGRALMSAGLTEADLLPVWHCPKCSDTGFLPSGAACDCFDKAQKSEKK
jgi:hypothetical protein